MGIADKNCKKQLEELWGKVGFIVNLSQMIEYNLANILAFDEILREFNNADSMYLFEYNTFVSKANNLYNEYINYLLINYLSKCFTKLSTNLLKVSIGKLNKCFTTSKDLLI